jgi:CDP-diacylglycerol---serine O-phosphatidyltransferase
MVLDGLDGRVARLTNTQSEFGAQYDSLSDLVAFGLAPALIAYLWQLHELGNLGWVAAFFYATATALRLARFNSSPGCHGQAFLPGASQSGQRVRSWLRHRLGNRGSWPHFPPETPLVLMILALAVTVLAGVLMVGNLTYFSFKDMDFRHRVPFFAMLAVVGVLMLAALDPPKVLLAGVVLYALSGPDADAGALAPAAVPNQLMHLVGRLRLSPRIPSLQCARVKRSGRL